MKRWEYSSGWKGLAVILNQACAVILVLSVIVCTLYVGSGGFAVFGQDDSFENTVYYQNEAEEQIRRCIRAVSRESKFEKNGAYDAKMLVDIQEYAQTNRILDAGQEEGRLCYKLTDLLNWSMDGYEIGTLMKITYTNGRVGYMTKGSATQMEQSVYDENGAAVSSSSIIYGAEETYEEFPVEAAEEAPLTEENASEEIVTEEVLTEETFMEDVVTYEDLGYYDGARASIQNVEEIEVIKERYAPAGYSGVIEYAEQQKLSTEELQDLYWILENTISEIYNDFYSYKENLELFSPSMTNMRYMVIPLEVDAVTEEDYEQKTYTNIKSFGSWEIQNREDLLEYFKGQGSYLIFDSSDMSFESSRMPLSLSEVSSYLKEYQPSVPGEYILAIGIDANYMASDNLQEYWQQYDEVRPLSRAAVYGAILGSVLYLLTLVYLTLAAGRGTDGEDRSIRLNSFDRIKTETAILVLMLPTVLVLGIAYWLRPAASNGLMEAGIWGGSVTFALNFLFLMGYLSLVKRMKSRILWSNSVCHAVAEVFANMFRNREATTKTVITYLVFLIVNLLLLCCGLTGFLLALLFDFIIGILLIQQALQRQKILDGIKKISEGDLTHQIPLEKLNGDSLLLAKAVNNIGGGLSTAVEKSVKDERLKSDLITNVSHDIKTPLTSIINYVDLLKREDIQNERARNYIAILEDKAQRLKHLTDDLVEASKISSGNVTLEFVRINFQELINQTNGEFSEKFENKGLQLVLDMPQEPVVIEADGRRLWRIIENLYNNVAKYAMSNTRVYVELAVVGHMVRFSIKNISEQPLNIAADELTERFIRGDVARSTEGSGLGLSIARNLTELQKGSFDIYLDGDLFKVTIIFPEAPKVERSETGPEEKLEESFVDEPILELPEAQEWSEEVLEEQKQAEFDVDK